MQLVISNHQKSALSKTVVTTWLTICFQHWILIGPSKKEPSTTQSMAASANSSKVTSLQTSQILRWTKKVSFTSLMSASTSPPNAKASHSFMVACKVLVTGVRLKLEEQVFSSTLLPTTSSLCSHKTTTLSHSRAMDKSSIGNTAGLQAIRMIQITHRSLPSWESTRLSNTVQTQLNWDPI